MVSYAVGLAVWIGAFWVGASLFPDSPYASVLAGFTAAATLSALYFTQLYVTAVGSPMGNLFAPTLLTIGVPYPAIAAVAPATSDFSIIEAVHLGPDAVLPYGIALLLPGCVVYFWHRLGDRSEWESRVMPEAFGVQPLFDSRNRSSGAGPLLVSPETVLTEAIVFGVLLFISIWAFAIVFVLFLEGRALEMEHVVGPYFVFLVCLYLFLRTPSDLEEPESDSTRPRGR